MKALEVFFIYFGKRWVHLPRGTAVLMLLTILGNVFFIGDDDLLYWATVIAALGMLIWVLNQPAKE